CASFQYSGCYW
nr:immunoglobulin heavy chain junction region [Macaca mulatta]